MHHAELIIGGFEEAQKLLGTETLKGSPDTRYFEADRFGIEEARTLVREAALLPIKEEVRTFVIVFREATMEAQNALLKTLEEPVATTRFFVVVPREDVLIKTVRSRLMRSGPSVVPEASRSALAKDFLQSPYGTRLEAIAEKAKAKDGDWMEAVLRGIEEEAARKSDGKLMRATIMARKYFGSAGASKKMLLEHLALLV